MKSFIIILIAISSLLIGCAQDISNNNAEIYEEFWTFVDENYIYFEEKQVNWDQVRERYISRLHDLSSKEDLFNALEGSLLTLRDNHNRLEAPFQKGKSYNFKAGFEIHFSPDLVESDYIAGDFTNTDDLFHGYIGDVLYIYISTMKYNRSLRNLIRREYREDLAGIILDIRGNGGGNSNGVPDLLGDFVKEKTLLGSYIEKSGPAHTDRSIPLPVYAEPSSDFYFDKPVAVLTDRGSYSASSYFAAMLKGLENVTLVGQITGGGGGGNSGYQLSNDWVLAVSVSDFIDKEEKTIETGVQPDIAIENTAKGIANGEDEMLERALGIFK